MRLNILNIFLILYIAFLLRFPTIFNLPLRLYLYYEEYRVKKKTKYSMLKLQKNETKCHKKWDANL